MFTFGTVQGEFQENGIFKNFSLCHFVANGTGNPMRHTVFVIHGNPPHSLNVLPTIYLSTLFVKCVNLYSL